ncbi:integrase [uncultured Amnibacterium sp.]|uniref:integrase n=1 Tax=uncultured Amnibacterium sp. TaxID=1631851 RepID=UPI0035CB0782
MSLGANVKTLQRMLGHASAAVTLDVYADLFDSDNNALSVVLDRVASRPFRVHRRSEPEKVRAL